MGKYDKLRVGTHILQDAGTQLQYVSNEFGSAGDTAKNVAGLVGHDGLASAVRDFADKWNDKRKKLKESMDAVATAATQIGLTIDQVDEQLAQVLEPDPAACGTTPAPSLPTPSIASPI